jgi:hypothetical protein
MSKKWPDGIITPTPANSTSFGNLGANARRYMAGLSLNGGA